MAKRISKINDRAINDEVDNIYRELNSINVGSTAWADILNKPTTFAPSTHTQSASTITEDTTHRFVTDTQIALWSSSSGEGHPALSLGVANGLTIDGANQILGMTAADSTHTGALTSTDWNTFNGKENGLTFNSPLARAADIISFLYNDTNLKLTGSELDTIQDINTGASPAFVQLSLSSAATGTSHAVRADRTITLTGTTNQVNVSTGAQNLTANRIWTLSLPQDIHTGASPTFVNLNLTGYADVVTGYKVSATTAIDSSRNAFLNNITLSGLIDQNGAGVNTLTGDLSSDSYVSGYFGAGWKVWRDANGANGEIDNFIIRNSLRAHIFQKDVVKALNGFSYFTDSDEIVAESATSDTTKYIYTKNNYLQSGFLVWYKDIDDAGSTITGIKITITSSGTLVTLPNSDQEGYRYTYTIYSGTGTFKVGGTVVRVGSTTSTGQGGVYIDASGASAPFIDIFDGVDNWAYFQSADKTVARIGKLDGITDAAIGALDGYGIYTNRGFFTEDVLIGGRSVGMLNGMTALFHFDDSVIDSFHAVKPTYTGILNETPYGLITSSGGGIVATRTEGKYGGGIAVEAATTNYVVNPDFRLTTGWLNNPSYYTGDGYLDNKCVKQVITVANTYFYQDITSLTAGQTYTISFYAKVTAGTLSFTAYDPGGFNNGVTLAVSATANGSQWKRYTMTRTLGAGITGIRLWIRESGTPTTFYIDKVQIENKAFATAFVDGTRAAGVLKYSLELLQPSAFGISFNAYIDFNKINSWSDFIDIGADNDNSLRIERNSSDNYFNLIFFKGGVSQGSDSGTVLTAGWHHFVLTFTGTQYILYCDGAAYATITTSSLIPSSGYIWLLTRNNSGLYTNTLIDEFAIFNRALTAKEAQKIYYANQPFNESAGMTYISGNHIKTGLLESENWSSLTSGSLINLNTGYWEANSGSGNFFFLDPEAGTAKINTFNFDESKFYNDTLKIFIGDVDGLSGEGIYLGNDGSSRVLNLQSAGQAIQLINNDDESYIYFANGVVAGLSKQLQIGDLTSLRATTSTFHTGFGIVDQLRGSVSEDPILYFKLSDTGNQIAAFTFDESKLHVGTDFVLDAANKKWYFHNKSTYASTTAGIFMGLDSGAYKFNIGDSTKYIKWDGSNLDTAGATITGGVIQSATSGQRVVITNNNIRFYPTEYIYSVNLRAEQLSSYTVLKCINDDTTTIFSVATGTTSDYFINTTATSSESTVYLAAANSKQIVLRANSSYAQIEINSLKVLGARDTGWTAATGTANKGTFNADTANTTQTAQRLKAVEDALRAHGLIN